MLDELFKNVKNKDKEVSFFQSEKLKRFQKMNKERIINQGF